MNADFRLSDADCERLRAALEAESAAALENGYLIKSDAFRTALRILHAAQMAAFDRRSIRRRAKSRESMDSLAAKDG